MTFRNKGGVKNASEARRKPLPRVCSQERGKKTYLGFSHSPSLKPRREGMEGMAVQRKRKRERRQVENRGAGVLELGDGGWTWADGRADGRKDGREDGRERKNEGSL